MGIFFSSERVGIPREVIADVPEESMTEQMLASLGVTDDSLNRYLANVTMQLERFKKLHELILYRYLREDIHNLTVNLGAIIENCREDQNDIREEVSLPDMMSRLADTLEADVVRLLTTNRIDDPKICDDVELLVTNVKRAISWTSGVLERMKSNDGLSQIHRARVISSVFEK